MNTELNSFQTLHTLSQTGDKADVTHSNEPQSGKSAVNRSNADFTVFAKLRNTCADVDAQADGSIEGKRTRSNRK